MRLIMRWSPMSSVFSMEPEGITRAWPSVPLISRKMSTTHIQAMISRRMSLERDSFSSVFLSSCLTDFILHPHLYSTLFPLQVHSICTFYLSGLRRVRRGEVRGRFALPDVRSDGARAHVQHKG